MAVDMSLKELEKKAWVSTFEDGLFDLTLGAVVVLVALGILIREFGAPAWSRFVFYVLMIGTPVLIMVCGKRLITLPRAGSAKFGPRRRRRIRGARVVVALAVCLTVGLLVLMVAAGQAPGSVAAIVPFVPAALVLAVFSLIGWLHQLRRLYVYAVLLAAGWVAMDVGGTPLPLLVLGLAIGLVGALMLGRFVRAYPVSSEEAGDVNG